MGGEKPDIYRQLSLLGGSPPHGRGKDINALFAMVKRRITPAWAGKRPRGVPAGGCVWDHPRVGGEKPLQCCRLRRSRGSPPRGRGKGKSVDCVREEAGITPAWAGKSSHDGNAGGLFEDHPRVGGEKYFSSRTSMCVKGSPPRGRGKAAYCILCDDVAGITPAWAGKRLRTRMLFPSSGDHPRMGGEKHSKKA